MSATTSRSGAAPATVPEVCSIEVRDDSGGLVRKLRPGQADELVQRGFGEWRRASNGRWFVYVFNSPTSSTGWLSNNGRTTRKVRVWDANGQAVSAPVIVEHRGVITKN
jgi:hypothetical protein